MYENLLPVGSVVLLKGGNKKIMIIGRIQARAGEDKIYDYAATYYPEGMVAPDSVFFFDRDAIDRYYFIGYQDEDELSFRTEVLGSLGELKVENGQIVPVASEAKEEEKEEAPAEDANDLGELK